MLVKITEPTHTIFFQVEDIISITPVFLFREVDYYRLDLKLGFQVKLSSQQLTRLTPFLGYIDLSIDIDKPEDITLPLEGDDFESTISELLDMAISSTSIRPQHTHLDRLKDAQTVLKH